MNWWERWQARRALRRLQRQRQDINTRVLSLMARLDEARRYVGRDRAEERAYIARLLHQRREAREVIYELQEVVRVSLHGQALLQAELQARRAAEVLASDFGDLGPATSSTR